jgi:hypothetical protein
MNGMSEDEALAAALAASMQESGQAAGSSSTQQRTGNISQVGDHSIRVQPS